MEKEVFNWDYKLTYFLKFVTNLKNVCNCDQREINFVNFIQDIGSKNTFPHIFLKGIYRGGWGFRPWQIVYTVTTMHVTCMQMVLYAYGNSCTVLICFYRSQFCSPAINQISLSQSKGCSFHSSYFVVGKNIIEQVYCVYI